MMWRSIAVLAAMSLPAMAANTQQDAPFEAATVQAFLTACERDSSQCDYEIRETLLDKLPAQGAVSVCLNGAHYQKPVIAWLKAHPESQPMATEDGIYAAIRSLYPCP